MCSYRGRERAEARSHVARRPITCALGPAGCMQSSLTHAVRAVPAALSEEPARWSGGPLTDPPSHRPRFAPTEALTEGLRGRCGYAAAAGCHGLRQASPAARAELTYHTHCRSRHMQQAATVRPCGYVHRSHYQLPQAVTGGGVGGDGIGKNGRPS